MNARLGCKHTLSPPLENCIHAELTDSVWRSLICLANATVSKSTVLKDKIPQSFKAQTGPKTMHPAPNPGPMLAPQTWLQAAGCSLQASTMNLHTTGCCPRWLPTKANMTSRYHRHIYFNSKKRCCLHPVQRWECIEQGTWPRMGQSIQF